MAEDKKTSDDYKVENFLIQIKEKEKEKPKVQVVKDTGVIEEIRSIIMIAIGFLLMISIYIEESGKVGKLLKNISSHLFGSGSAFLPIFVISIGVYFIVSKKKVKTKILMPFLCMYFCLLGLMFTLTPVPEQASPVTLQQEFAESIKRGGFVGGVIGAVLIGIIGKIGAILFLIAGVIISFMLATGKSFLGFLKSIVSYIKGKINTEITQIFSIDKDESKKKKPKNKNLFDYIMGVFDEEIDQIKDKEDTYQKEKIHEEIHEQIKEDIKEEIHEQIHEEIKEEVYQEVHKEKEISPNLFYDDEEEFQKFDRNKLFELDNTTENNNKMPERLDELPIPGKTVKENVGDYKFPSILCLNKNTFVLTKNVKEQAEQTKAELQNIFNEYKVDATVEKYYRGPTVTRYEISPGQGVKVNRISGLSDEIALKLAARGIRIEAPIPGKPFVGIEIPNKEGQPVFFRDIIDSQNFRQMASKITFGVGKDIEGNSVVWDIKEMPHMLIAGATGSGKSVCINTLIMSILYKATPDEVKLLMIDPKRVELGVYNGIPHLLIPVVVDPKKAAGALNWAVREMTARYTRFSEDGVRNIEGYNQLKKKNDDETLPQIVIIIDELSDLMQTSSSEVEDNIKRLSQMARAAGIYLIIATQRPSVDVITGVIKANIPSRLAFAVSSGTDSRTILDTVGAEKLLGKGDMLFYPKGISKPLRLQGAFISDKEVEEIVAFFKKNFEVNYDEAMIDEITSTKEEGNVDDEVDELFLQAVEFLIEKGKGSASLLQRQFKIGYNRAARLIEQLENRGIVAPADGSKPRKVLMTKAQFDEL